MEGLQAVHPFTNSVSEDSGFELNVHRLRLEKSCSKDKQGTCTNVIENDVNKALQASYSCPAIKKDHVINEEVCVDEILHLQSPQEQLAGNDPTSEEDKVYNSKDISLCKELIISDVRLHKCLMKSATFPSSEVETLDFFYHEINGASPSSAAVVQNSSVDQPPVYKRSTSLPASSKLVSAMKGGRTQNGTSPTIDMRVKWAVDVYDPPPTSMSHTVKTYNTQRPTKSKKRDNHRQKHNKSKNSRGNSSGKKFPNRGNVGVLSAPFPAKLQAGGANGSAAQTEEIFDFAVGGAHDVKCGSIFLRESLAKDKTLEDDPMTDIPAADPIEVAKNSEELPADKSADTNAENVDPSFSFRHNFSPADPIIISDDQPVTTDSHVISNDEFQAFRAEMSKLKEQVVRLRGELVDVNKKLEKITVKVLEENKFEQFMNGAICLLQKLVRKGVISLEEAMDPSLWN